MCDDFGAVYDDFLLLLFGAVYDDFLLLRLFQIWHCNCKSQIDCKETKAKAEGPR
jgi:hypothetical protein